MLTGKPLQTKTRSSPSEQDTMFVSNELKAGTRVLRALFQYWPSTTPPLAIRTPVGRGYVAGVDDVLTSGAGDSSEDDVDEVVTSEVGEISEDNVDEVIMAGVGDSSKDVDEVVTSGVGDSVEEDVDEVIMAGVGNASEDDVEDVITSGVGESVVEDVVEEEGGVSRGSRYKPSTTVQSVTEAFPR
jgi:hypothetical protein